MTSSRDYWAKYQSVIPHSFHMAMVIVLLAAGQVDANASKQQFMSVCQNPSPDERLTLEALAGQVQLDTQNMSCAKLHTRMLKEKSFDNHWPTLRTLSPAIYFEHLEKINQIFEKEIPAIDFEPLSKLTRLTELNLERTDTPVEEADIGAKKKYPVIHHSALLRSLKNLRTLELSNMGIEDLSFLAGMKKLVTANLSNNLIRTLVPEHLPRSIESLRLHGNLITPLPSLNHMTNLRQLNLSSNTFNDISPLRGLVSLTELGMARAILSKDTLFGLEALSTLTNLQTLNLYGWDIVSVEFVRPLKKLEMANFARNKIVDLRPFNDLSRLQKLIINDNDNIDDLSPLKPLAMTSNVEISSTTRKLKSCSPVNARQLRAGITCDGGFFQDILNSFYKKQEQRQYQKSQEWKDPCDTTAANAPPFCKDDLKPP